MLSLLMYCEQIDVSAFGPLLLIMYTTSLSTLISPLPLNYHLYADDTQLFFIIIIIIIIIKEHL